MNPVVLALLIFFGVLIALLATVARVLRLGAPRDEVQP